MNIETVIMKNESSLLLMDANPKAPSYIMLNNIMERTELSCYSNMPLYKCFNEDIINIIYEKYAETDNTTFIVNIIHNNSINSNEEVFSFLNSLYTEQISTNDLIYSFVYLETLKLADNYANILDDIPSINKILFQIQQLFRNYFANRLNNNGFDENFPFYVLISDIMTYHIHIQKLIIAAILELFNEYGLIVFNEYILNIIIFNDDIPISDLYNNFYIKLSQRISNDYYWMIILLTKNKYMCRILNYTFNNINKIFDAIPKKNRNVFIASQYDLLQIYANENFCKIQILSNKMEKSYMHERANEEIISNCFPVDYNAESLSLLRLYILMFEDESNNNKAFIQNNLEEFFKEYSNDILEDDIKLFNDMINIIES